MLDQHGALGETKECPAGVAKLGCPNQHRPVDVVPFLGVRIDGRAAVDEGVEERKRARQLESLGAKLEHQERCVARRLDVDGDELGFVQERLRTELGSVDRDLLPGHGLSGPARLQENRLHD